MSEGNRAGHIQCHAGGCFCRRSSGDKRAQAKYKAEYDVWRSSGSGPVEEPTKPPPQDSIVNRMTWVGLGQHMHQQDGCAILALHEGRTFLQHTFEGSVGGGIEELNQLSDHDCYKNTISSQSGRYWVKNPHLIALVMMHCEEIVQQASQEDSVAGLSRFLLAKFPCRVLKIRDPQSAEQAQNELDECFNSLGYDQVVSAMAHVLTISKLLFPHNEARDDDAEHRCFSHVSGLHTMPFAASVKQQFIDTFNKYVDKVRADQKVLGGQSSRLNKEKTRALQFIAPLDVFEKVIAWLLQKDGHRLTEGQDTELSGEEIIRSLAHVRSLVHIECDVTGKFTAGCSRNVRAAALFANYF